MAPPVNANRNQDQIVQNQDEDIYEGLKTNCKTIVDAVIDANTTAAKTVLKPIAATNYTQVPEVVRNYAIDKTVEVTCSVYKDSVNNQIDNAYETPNSWGSRLVNWLWHKLGY